MQTIVPEFTLTRRGKISFSKVEHDETQCGVRGTRTLFYRVEIKCQGTDALDGNGFLVDQLKLAHTISAKYRRARTIPSCENLALDIAKLSKKMCKNVIGVMVVVGANKMAFMRVSI